MITNADDRATAQVIHALAVLADKGMLDEECWPGIARILLDQGFRWPAIRALAARDEPTEYRVLLILKDLAAQTERDLADGPIADPWDVVAGIYGRAWRFGLLDETLAMWRMDHVCFHLRGLPDDERCLGMRLLWRAMGVKEADGEYPSADVPAQAEAVLAQADSLLAPRALSYTLCEAIRAAMDDAAY
ncbi:hypothetical protein [Nocardia jejuensis]|uniref:hypothetical protein n=1 Tax=Nocardia jejuensis TaxID=328049 RepID=UPI00082CA7E3|nr:hypothetical protein [Nocardia jejuensis]